MNQAQQTFINDCKARIRAFYEPYADGELVIYGAGSYGRMLLSLFREFGFADHVVAFCDGNEQKWGSDIDGIPVKGLDQLATEHPKAVYIIASDWRDEIGRRVREKGLFTPDIDSILPFMEKQLSNVILDAPDDRLCYIWKWMEWYEQLSRQGKLAQYVSEIEHLLEDDRSREILQRRLEFFRTGNIDTIQTIPQDQPIYFRRDYLPFTDNEVLFDCGAYTGDTLDEFICFAEGKYHQVNCFEPDEKNYIILNEYVKNRNDSRVKIIKSAVGAQNGEICFSNDGTTGSRVQKEGIKVKLVKLDDYIEDQPTYIKMDLEGTEMDALKGAENSIRTYKPKLAISVYHKWLDFYEIPMWIHQIVPEYHFKLRHHTDDLCDTVVYAWVE